MALRINPNQPSGAVDTGGTDPTGFTDYDGIYFGTYSMSLSIGARAPALALVG